MTVLPKVLESMTGVRDDEEPDSSCHRSCGEHDEHGCDGHFDENDLWRPSATVKPTNPHRTGTRIGGGGA